MTEENKVRIRAVGTNSFRVSAFPNKQWDEWKQDCKDNFGDCHWIKIWHDHVRVKDLDKIEKLDKRIEALEFKIDNKKKEEESYVETMGGKIKKGDD